MAVRNKVKIPWVKDEGYEKIKNFTLNQYALKQ
jgi:hypothetical protein